MPKCRLTCLVAEQPGITEWAALRSHKHDHVVRCAPGHDQVAYVMGTRFLAGCWGSATVSPNRGAGRSAQSVVGPGRSALEEKGCGAKRPLKRGAGRSPRVDQPRSEYTAHTATLRSGQHSSPISTQPAAKQCMHVVQAASLQRRRACGRAMVRWCGLGARGRPGPVTHIRLTNCYRQQRNEEERHHG